MKKGFLLTKSAPKIASTSSTTQVTPIPAKESPPFDRYYDVIIDFVASLAKENPESFGGIIAPDPTLLDQFYYNNRNQIVPLDKLSRTVDSNDCYPPMAQFFATLLNIFILDEENQARILIDSEIRREWEAHTNKQSPEKEDLGDPMYQSDMSINIDVLDASSIGSLDDEILATPPRNITPIPVTPLTKSQKRSAKKKARKEKKKALQLQTPSGLDE
ncbi:hypothetical protein RCL_jg1198.t1 [Rhizophagus clarus]|uniref:Uncharacterized protein n=1 Tax=Rhizophagus clarus TaxID=94130 RepID=A0A8H3QL85_9GLOM|nr:hypothetical protein RCL_jg1198.t1 [Rhizophagus clarus]